MIAGKIGRGGHEGTAELDGLDLYVRLVHIAASVHFAPTIIAFDDNYASAAFRVSAWHNFLAGPYGTGTEWGIAGVCAVAIGSSTAGALGLFPRLTAAVSGLSWWTLASINALHSHTLALSTLWAIYWLMAIFSYRDSNDAGKLKAAIALYLLGSVFFSGVEKIIAGWPYSDSILRLTHYPYGGMVRSWVLNGVTLSASTASALELAILLAELCIPILIVIRRTRFAGLLAYVAFFTVVTATLAIPPLFVALYMGGVLLPLSCSTVPRPLQKRTI